MLHNVRANVPKLEEAGNTSGSLGAGFYILSRAFELYVMGDGMGETKQTCETGNPGK